MAYPHGAQLEAMGEILADYVQGIFTACGAADDFCIQHVGCFSIVFGGTNRVVWRPGYGLQIDREYCTPNFTTNFDSLYGQGGK